MLRSLTHLLLALSVILPVQVQQSAPTPDLAELLRQLPSKENYQLLSKENLIDAMTAMMSLEEALSKASLAELQANMPALVALTEHPTLPCDLLPSSYSTPSPPGIPPTHRSIITHTRTVLIFSSRSFPVSPIASTIRPPPCALDMSGSNGKSHTLHPPHASSAARSAVKESCRSRQHQASVHI